MRPILVASCGSAVLFLVLMGVAGIPPTALAAQQSGSGAPCGSGIPSGWRLIEGDILVPEAGRGPSGLWTTKFWPNGVVPFEYDANVTPANQALMAAAMQVWENVANVQFVARSGHSNYVHIQDSTENSSMVGMVGGKQVLNIFNWNFQFIMAHELGHALGLWHEQSRTDRDTYVTVETARIESGFAHNFDKHDEADVYPPNVYDFDSVMHYGQCAFSCCDATPPCGTGACSANPGTCRTITVNATWAAAWQNNIGQRDHLSDFDEMTMSFLYPEADWVFVDSTATESTEDGTFLQPYREFRDGVAAVPVGGTVIAQPGVFDDTGTFATAMIWRAPLGDVVLGE